MAAEAIARNLVTPVFPVTSHTGNLGNPESLSVEGLGTGVLPPNVPSTRAICS